ncbi:MAG: kinase [Actinomycetota bacterium]|nr:kinase [Actinomycetota bacterium]
MKAVGLVPHRDRAVAHELARRARAWLGERGVEVRVPEIDAGPAGLGDCAVAASAFAKGLDLVLALGGDGTMLHAVQLVYPEPVPILGVNAGQLGYLSAIEASELEAALPRLLRGEFEVSERMMLEIVVKSTTGDRGVVERTEYALNDAVVEKVGASRLIRLLVSINGTVFTTYAADGVIIATATGSTAYSFSARGPIVSPAHRCLLLTPVSPHMLFDRSLVLGADEELELLVTDGRPVTLTVDGRESGQLAPGELIVCRAAPGGARLVARRPDDFHQLLKAKFGLTDR